VAIEAIYAAYWQRGEDVTQDAVLAAALRAAGLHDVDRALARADDHKEDLRARTEQAIALGIFGAPAWVRGETLIWGQDRMPWVEAVLDGWNPEAGPPPGGPRPLRFDVQARANATVEVYFDVASPFAYLGLTQLRALVDMGAQVRLVPILLGALFREIGQVDVPLFAMPAAKARYVGLDMMRWARWWGVPFDAPAKFPQRTVTAQRLALLAAEQSVDAGITLAAALGRAMWAEQRDLEDDATLRAILEAHGFSPGLVERTREPEVKAKLAANTAAARAANVFGVPTFVAGGQLFWGQDRLELVGRALAGEL
jgi:2-hydroxychromene-2-carboxylate isomerase